MPEHHPTGVTVETVLLLCLIAQAAPSVGRIYRQHIEAAIFQKSDHVTFQSKEIIVIYTSREIIAVNFIMVTFLKRDILDDVCDLF